MPQYADIVLPLAQPAYTFAISEGMEVRIGDAVAVQFGKNSLYTGIVWRLHDTPPKRGTAKPIIKVLYDKPLLSEVQIRFWEWIAEYYISTIGEVMRIALPSTIKPKARCEEEFEPYTPKRERVVRLIEEALSADVLEKMARRAPKRSAAVEALRARGGEAPRHEVALDATALNALHKAGVVEIYERELATHRAERNTLLPTLSEAQNRALNEIRQGFTTHNVTLLYGVTSSGKTEIYTHLIEEQLSQGRDVLFLVPEISLTTQLVERLRNLFGECVVAYHSKFSPKQRTKIYTDMLAGEGGNFIVGARSALFLPYKRLGLVIVDEEHDASYKQSEPNPRYNGRDTAIMLASLHGGKSLLGSATPSIESFSNHLSGKYAYVKLMERYGGVEMPRIVISDTIRNVKRNERKLHFNKELLDAIEERLARNEQVILFQNRRGYTPYLECPQCGYSARCPHCNVSLSVHQQRNRAVCHYCGYNEPITSHCPNCRTVEMKPMGFGTERVEEALQEVFPKARILRLDGDTATSNSAYSRIIGAFARKDADILVGTQIIAKGLDFGNVTLIGILNGDNLLAAPDFRAEERALQLLLQVAGRCGRREEQGEVIIQSADPKHRIYSFINNYEAGLNTMLTERQRYSYPPYVRLLRITLRDNDVKRLVEVATLLGDALRRRFGRRVLGPVSPLIDRIRREHRIEILLKIENSASFAKARAIVREEITALRSQPSAKRTTIICDVDLC